MLQNGFSSWPPWTGKDSDHDNHIDDDDYEDDDDCNSMCRMGLLGLARPLTTTCRCSLVTTRTAEHTASPFLTISRSQLALEVMSSVRDFNKPIFLKATKLITCAEVVVPPVSRVQPR